MANRGQQYFENITSKNKNKSTSVVSNILKLATSRSLSGNYSERKRKLHPTYMSKHKMFKTT